MPSSLSSYKGAFEYLPEPAILVTSDTLRILSCNHKAELFFGSAKGQEMVLLTERIQPWHLPRFLEAFHIRKFDSSELRGITAFTQEGKACQIDLLVSEVDTKPDVLSIVLADATNRLRLEEQLRQAQKMEAVGMLAGGIAHDFNNLLTIISGYSHMLASSLAEDDRNRFAAEQVIKASDRAAALTKQLLSFSRRQVAANKVLDLNGLIHGMEPMLNRIIGEHIRLRLSPGEGLGKIHADPGQIEQIVMNLVVNARDAMPNGGTLKLETGNTVLNAHDVTRHLEARPGEYVMLALTDSGIGMDAATRERIFEPFFTTKDDGKGTGLGLSTVFEIAKRTGGAIDVYSEPGQGTVVKVYLPRAEKQESETKADKPGTIARGHETLLLVEDEEAVRNIVRAALEAQGYLLLVASSGEEALRLAKDHSGPIDLLITDVVLPVLNGKEVARRLHKRKPEMAVLFMSGYTDVELNDSVNPDKQLHFISKPFTPAGLSRKVRELLDGVSTNSHTSL